MPNRTLTINNADGSSETYTINRDKFEGVREMTRGHVYPKILGGSFSSDNVTFQKADEKTFTLVASNSTSDKYITFVNPTNGIRLGKHQITFDLTRNSGSTSSIIGFFTDEDTDPDNGGSYGNYAVTEGSNVIDFEIFDDGADPSPEVVWKIESGSTFDISVTNFKITCEPDTVAVDHTPQPDVRTLLADGETITIDTTRTPVRTITIDGRTITIDRSDEVVVDSFIEQFTAPKLAFSLRDLVTTTGETTVVDVRRSSDNTTATFTATEVNDGTLTTWVKAGNEGFVSKWYDQSGNDHHVVQADPTKQPQIVDAVGLISGGLALNGGQMLRSTDRFEYPTGTTLSSFVTNKATLTGNIYLVRFQSDYMLWRLGNSRRVTAGANAAAGSISFNEELWSVISNLDTSGGTSNFYVDGVLASTPDVSHGSKDLIPQRFLEIGGSTSSAFWTGTINEVIIYDTDQSANREAIEANIMTKYSI